MPSQSPPGIDRAVSEAQRLLVQLCRQPSVAAQGLGIAEMAALTEDLLRDSGFATQRLAIAGAPPIIYGEQRGRGPFTLLLYNHYDVQPAEPLDLWHSPPFEPTVRDGMLFARGAADNKGEIATRLAAIRAWRAEHGELPITVRWIIEGEEEIGSVHFGEIIAPHADLLQADGALWEGAGFRPDGRPVLCLGFKGLLYLQLDLELLGRDAHSSLATRLPSAAWRLVQALGTLRGADGRVRIPGFYDAVRPPTQAQLDALADGPNMDAEILRQFGIERFNDGLTGAPLAERDAFSPTCNLAGLLAGYTGEGVKTVLPARAMAKIDFRLVPDQDPQAILEGLRAHLDDAGFPDIQVTTLGSSAPVVTPFDHPFARGVADIAAGFEGKRPAIVPIAGGTLPLLEAMRRQAGLLGVSTAGNPVYHGNNVHAPDEHIRLADLEGAVRFNYHLLQSLGQG